jgi:L-amino acid N-acyltransferase
VNSVQLREAREEDLEALNRIYNHYVLHSDCTLQTEPSTLQERREWFATQGARPVLVATLGEEVVGWGALIQYNPRAGYRFTLEDSLYLRHDMTGRGLGRLLLEELLVRARALGAHSVLAKIVATQERSLALHARCGFTEVGRLREVGFKLERWVDVVFMQRLLT